MVVATLISDGGCRKDVVDGVPALSADVSSSPVLPRRTSARVKKLEAEKALRRCGVKEKEELLERSETSEVRKRIRKPKENSPNRSSTNVVDDGNETGAGGNLGGDYTSGVSESHLASQMCIGKRISAKAIETIRVFNYSQEEEKRVGASEQKKSQASKKRKTAEDDAKSRQNYPDLKAMSKVSYTRSRIPQSVSKIRGLVCEDISGGLETIPVLATNLVDDPPVPPTGFTYQTRIQVAKTVKLPGNAPGCSCKGVCNNPKKCACARLNGSDFPYVLHLHGSRLIEPRDVVFECGPKCGCGPGCVNRTSQQGLRYRLEVFRTAKKGWGVRSWDCIPSGAPVCEFIGVVMKAEDVKIDCDDTYIFDIDCLQTMKGLDGREKRMIDVVVPSSLDKTDDNSVPEYCIDGGSVGNVSRFINHSCEPNLFVQCVLSSHHDAKLARIVLFAADDIPPFKELSYDYGYAVDSVLGPDGKPRKLSCFCGEPDCRKRLL